MLRRCLYQQFLPCTARFWNFFSPKYFPLTYAISGFPESIDTFFTLCSFLSAFLRWLLLFLVISCLVVAVHPCMEWSPIFNNKIFKFGFTYNHIIIIWPKSQFFVLFLSKYRKFRPTRARTNSWGRLKTLPIFRFV